MEDASTGLSQTRKKIPWGMMSFAQVDRSPEQAPWIDAPLVDLSLYLLAESLQGPILEWAHQQLESQDPSVDSYLYCAEHLAPQEIQSLKENPKFLGIEESAFFLAIQWCEQRFSLENKLFSGTASAETIVEIESLDKKISTKIDETGLADEFISEVRNVLYTRLLLYRHVRRQVSQLESEEMKQWANQSAYHGFHLALAIAAVVGSDRTKFSPTETEKWLLTASELGLTPQDIDFGVDKLLLNLRLHSIAGAAYTATSLRGFLESYTDIEKQCIDRVVDYVAQSILGHDSFRAGWGRDVLVPLLGKIPNFPTGLLEYEISQNPCGFLVQLLDRLDATLSETIFRYAKQEVDRGIAVPEAIKHAVTSNVTWLQEIKDQIETDAERVLTANKRDILFASPVFSLFVTGIERLQRFAQRFTSESDKLCFKEEDGSSIPLGGLSDLARVLTRNFPTSHVILSDIQ